MSIESEIRANAELCVKCGMCLPHCPTYNKTGNENESPRGRISLIQAWAEGNLPASKKLLSHIDNCLLCRSCEKVCPAMVPYGKLVDEFRGCTRPKSRQTVALSLLKKVAHNRRLSNFTRLLLDAYQTSGLQNSGLAGLIRLGRINRLLPSKGRKPLLLEKQMYPSERKVQGKVGLFQGCMGSLLDQGTVSAAIKVLNRAGYDVYLPDWQTCCGALDLHSGDVPMAEKLAERNTEAFSDKSLDAIVTIASGCGAVMQEYDGRVFSEKVIDISHFLLQSNGLKNLQLAELDAKVAVHTPCSLRNVMRTEASSVQLLKRIPNLKVSELPEFIKCCGSAGSYVLEHPEMANVLVEDTIHEIRAQAPDFVATSNIGCAFHLAAGLKEKGPDLEVVHPVVLIERVLQDL